MHKPPSLWCTVVCRCVAIGPDGCGFLVGQPVQAHILNYAIYFFVVHAVGIKCSIYGAFARTIRALGLLQSQVVYNVHA